MSRILTLERLKLVAKQTINEVFRRILILNDSTDSRCSTSVCLNDNIRPFADGLLRYSAAQSTRRVVLRFLSAVLPADEYASAGQEGHQYPRHSLKLACCPRFEGYLIEQECQSFIGFCRRDFENLGAYYIFCHKWVVVHPGLKI